MCCLFGVVDRNGLFSGKERSWILSVLAIECEARGADATGIAYNSGGRMKVYKRPLAAHLMRLKVANDAKVIMGHTRLTTQGSEKYNWNNHPFLGRVGNMQVALAHNGMLYNDKSLRKSMKLPTTNIETDSYIALQLLEKKGTLTFDSLKEMAEKVEGSFSFTILDGGSNLYFVKGDNPLCLYEFPESRVLFWASTKDILDKAMKKLNLKLGRREEISMDCGDILKISADGQQTRGWFDPSNLYRRWYEPISCYYPSHIWETPKKKQEKGLSAITREYIRNLKNMASYLGYSKEVVDDMLSDGFTLDEVEELLYCGGV